MRAKPLALDVPAPWFICRAQTRERFAIDTIAGRYIVICFFGSAADPANAKVLEQLTMSRSRFDDVNLTFLGVSVDPEDERQQRVRSSLPGMRYIWDFDRAVSARYGAQQPDGTYQKITYVLDPSLRVLAVLPFPAVVNSHVPSLLAVLDRLPAVDPEYLAAVQAPILVVPRVFEPKLCRALVDYYTAHGGTESGFMDEVNGKTVAIMNHGHKRRRDCIVEDDELRRACMRRIGDRLVPEIHKAFQFLATRMERYIVACYDATEGGHFQRHRDNTTKGTAHRRFAVSLFLNSGDYEGGLLRFPEFGPALHTAPPGGAVVFSCSILHEATPVTRGHRYMFLPFLYDEAARQIRGENFRFLDTGISGENKDTDESDAAGDAR